MNKYERQSDQPAEHQLLSDELAAELSHIPTEVLEVGDAPPLAPRAPLTQREVRTILMSLMLTMFLAALDQTIVATALPTIGRQFQDVSSLSWVITAYLLASTAVAPVFGTLSDIYGRRAMIIVALSTFIAGSVLCALGAEHAGADPGARPAGSRRRRHHADRADRDLRHRDAARTRPVPGLFQRRVDRGRHRRSGARRRVRRTSALVDGVLDQFAARRIALATLLPKMRKIPVFHRKREVDWLGGILLMASAVVFMLVLTWGGNRFLWLSPTILAMLGSSVALAFAFVWHARNAREPFLPLPLLGGTVVPYAMAAGGCAMGAMIGLTVHLPLYYEVVYHLTASEAGLALIPLAAISTCGAAIAGKTMAHAKHYKRVAIIGLTCAAAVGCVFTFATLPLWTLLGLLALFSLGLGTAFPISVVSLQNSVSRAQVGTVTGAMNFFRALAASFTVAAFSTILLMALGADISLGGEHRGPVNSISAPDMIAAFRYVFAAATVLLADGIAVHGADGRTAAGRPGQAAGGDDGVGWVGLFPALSRAACSKPADLGYLSAMI